MAKPKPPKKNPNYRPKVKDKLKQALILEAGYKCANPGCPTKLVELHHIKEWRVYKQHNQAHMIAICPTCHHHAHHGLLKIDDETIRSWKQILRARSDRDFIYVEPREPIRILMGTLLLASDQRGPRSAAVFELSSRNRLGFRVPAEDILNLFLNVSDATGREVLKVIDGHVKHYIGDSIEYESRPGRVRVTAPATPDYLPSWVSNQCFGPSLVSEIKDGRFTLVDIEVVEPGMVRVQGVWAEDDRAIVVGRGQLAVSVDNTDGTLGFVHIAGYKEIRGDGGIATIMFNGPITHSMFTALLKRQGF